MMPCSESCLLCCAEGEIEDAMGGSDKIKSLQRGWGGSLGGATQHPARDIKLP
jgi:hypothetical protein